MTLLPQSFARRSLPRAYQLPPPNEPPPKCWLQDGRHLSLRTERIISMRRQARRRGTSLRHPQQALLQPFAPLIHTKIVLTTPTHRRRTAAAGMGGAQGPVGRDAVLFQCGHRRNALGAPYRRCARRPTCCSPCPARSARPPRRRLCRRRVRHRAHSTRPGRPGRAAGHASRNGGSNAARPATVGARSRSCIAAAGLQRQCWTSPA